MLVHEATLSSSWRRWFLVGKTGIPSSPPCWARIPAPNRRAVCARSVVESSGEGCCCWPRCSGGDAMTLPPARSWMSRAPRPLRVDALPTALRPRSLSSASHSPIPSWWRTSSQAIHSGRGDSPPARASSSSTPPPSPWKRARASASRSPPPRSAPSRPRCTGWAITGAPRLARCGVGDPGGRGRRRRVRAMWRADASNVIGKTPSPFPSTPRGSLVSTC